jgi:hypothetical protein
MQKTVSNPKKKVGRHYRNTRQISRFKKAARRKMKSSKR